VSGHVVVSLSLSGFMRDAQRLAVQPGIVYNCELLDVDPSTPDMPPRRVKLTVRVEGSVCPDPSAHALVCDETNYDRFGDCDYEVRRYEVREPVAGKALGEPVLLCGSHAMQHGSKIRRIAR
jgi:hypothetical protein